MLTRYIGIFESLALHSQGCTVGKIAGENLILTEAQIKRTIGELVAEGFVRVEEVPYRPHIKAKVYHMTEKAREYFGYVVDKYDRREKQTAIWDNTAPVDIVLDVLRTLEGKNA